ncbi:helix-turn-helix domain-containing protein [Pseudoalteromonas xiamenensis]|uniref:helix-turn-helix domain-containing protein n=1 Tax=Pseudoalteromonas xiamenensis TaxID=882626 RepID=UPI0027E41219|nr:helix-turn-helix transcriptional regulator [Pseudoalteromonas xiamenensis]WMN60693.1 helix-turn-helix domain-containing protein [Pseudoalteromonas xiamenensis]WMN60790.1 helix-turn-helix domain-containing protein [Pseudoalteromonas xiamenensis]
MQIPEEIEVTQRVREIIDNLKAKRGYTKKRVCDLLGIGQSTLDDYLNGKSSFKLDTLIKLSQISRLSLSEIVEGTKEYDYQLKTSEEFKLKEIARKGIELSLIILVAMSSGVYYLSFFVLALIAVYFLSKKSLGSQFIILTIVASTIIELGFTIPFKLFIYNQYSGYFQNNTIYSIHLIMDSITLTCIWNYQTLACYFHKSRSLKEILSLFDKCHIHAPMIVVYFAFCFVDIAAIVENQIRNMERLGLDETLASQFYHWQFIYDYYATVKVTLICCTAFLLISNLSIIKSTQKRASA